MQETASETEVLLRQLVLQNMDQDSFTILKERPTRDVFFGDQVLISCSAQDTDFPSSRSTRMLESPFSRAVAVVDRSADIDLAASQIIRARTSFCGRSPYAPDVVLVNEFAIKQFCQAAVHCLSQNLSAEPFSNANRVHEQQVVEQDSRGANLITLSIGARGSIKLLRSRQVRAINWLLVLASTNILLRDKSILNKKVTEPTLIIVSVSSLDDAIDMANAEDTSLLAAYFFADPRAAKYLSQFITADVSFTNHIPPQFLGKTALRITHGTSNRSRIQ